MMPIKTVRRLASIGPCRVLITQRLVCREPNPFSKSPGWELCVMSFGFEHGSIKLPMPNREFRACKPLVMMRLTTKLERLLG